LHVDVRGGIQEASATALGLHLNGGGGRLIIGSNVGAQFDADQIGDNGAKSDPTGLVTGISGQPSGNNLQGIGLTDVERFRGPGDTNPYIATSTWTPYLAGIDGGADVFGVVTGLDARSLDYNSTVAGTQGPDPNALVAVMRYDMSSITDNPLGLVYQGYDLIVFANVSGVTLTGAQIGFGTSHTLDSRGLSAETAITNLAANAVWAMLVPD